MNHLLSLFFLLNNPLHVHHTIIIQWMMGFFLKQNTFFVNKNSALFGISLKRTLILIAQEYFFWCHSKWRQIKENASDLNFSLSRKFWWLRSANHKKFTVECSIYTEKHILANKKENDYKWAEHVFVTTSLSQKVYRVDCWLVVWVLWHLKLCRSFNAKFCLYIHTYSTKDFKTNIKVGRIFCLEDFISLHKINQF